MWAVIPLKDFSTAKQRLTRLLSPDERQGLFRAMVDDVLGAAAGARRLAGVAAITRDAQAEALCRRHGVRILREAENRGHTAAVEGAAAQLAAEGVRGIVTFPGDIPTVTPAEIDAVVAAHRGAPAVTIAPSRDYRGSNAVALTPPAAMPLRFGSDSFYPHLAAARAVGIEPTVVELPGFALDVDTPEDLLALVDAGARGATAAFLVASGIAGRLAPDSEARRTAGGRS